MRHPPRRSTPPAVAPGPAVVPGPAVAAGPTAGPGREDRGSAVAEVLAALRGALPAELAERLRAGGAPAEATGPLRLATGIDAVDALLGGGFPRGRLSEITGPPSSGRTSLALALLAAATRAGEVTAVVDAADAFDPGSAAAAGVDLARVLWVRAPRPREALRCAERLLEARGFGVVVLDHAAAQAGDTPSSIWMRMSRSATASGTALVLVASSTRAGPFAALSLETRPARARFATRPPWLEGLESRLAPRRSRLGPAEGCARLCWKVPPGGAAV